MGNSRPSVGLTPRCLYCRETKPIELFNREHVVPEAFGKFDGNFVLNGVVCWACNQYFGDSLDRRIARDTIEGLDRYEHGVRRPNTRTAIGRFGVMRASVDGGFYDGAQVWWGPRDDDPGKLVLFPFPQVGIADEGGHQIWFPADQIPNRHELAAHGFAPGAPITIKLFGVSAEEAQGALGAKGFELSPLETINDPNAGQEVDIHITGRIDRTVMRGIAKIAFNYLAFQFPDVAAMHQFDAAREFIRYDATDSASPVHLAKGDMVAGVPADRVPVAHAVGVAWENGRVVAQVTLFFRFRYRIVLADGGFDGVPPIMTKGHLFNPMSKQIVELTTDPRLARPWPGL